MMRSTMIRCLKKLIIVGNPSQDCEAFHIFRCMITQESALLCCCSPALSKLSLLSTKYHAEICESESDHPYSEQFHHFPLFPQIVLSTDK